MHRVPRQAGPRRWPRLQTPDGPSVTGEALARIGAVGCQSEPKRRATLSTKRRAFLNFASLFACAIAVVGLVARYVPVTNYVVLTLAVLSPYLMLGAPVALAVLLIGKRWIWALVPAALTVALVAIQLPSYVGSGVERSEHVDLRLLTANLREGSADPRSFVALAREHADVVAVQELTAEEVERFSAAGMDAVFPYRSVDPHPEASGAGLWSRYPLHETSRGGEDQLAVIYARLNVPDVTNAPTIAVVHSTAPWPWPMALWRYSVARLATRLDELAASAGAGAVVMAGDLNSTRDMLQFRRLLRNGYHDADQQAGAGLSPTYPGDSWLPPIVSIDHVITHGATASSLRTVSIAGSDHRGLMVTVQIPRDATVSAP
jgi:endonuclease/exonuclease/phosphatase (EEP) superfamily protein YafD